jgi:hypothetical protein
VACFSTASAGAQQPLDAFVQGRGRPRPRRPGRPRRRRRGPEPGRRGPRGPAPVSVTLSGGYTRNQLEVVAEFGSPGDLQRAVISAQDQVDGRLQLDVVLVDIAAWSRFFGAESSAGAAAARAAGVQVAVNEAVVASYYRLAAGRALRRSAAESLATARQNLLVVQRRASAGLASELDLERARADVARVEQRGGGGGARGGAGGPAAGRPDRPRGGGRRDRARGRPGARGAPRALAPGGAGAGPGGGAPRPAGGGAGRRRRVAGAPAVA